MGPKDFDRLTQEIAKITLLDVYKRKRELPPLKKGDISRGWISLRLRRLLVLIDKKREEFANFPVDKRGTEDYIRLCTDIEFLEGGLDTEIKREISGLTRAKNIFIRGYWEVVAS